MSEENKEVVEEQVSTEEENVNEQENASTDDAEKNKGMAILAYIGFLFIVPLLAAKESKFAMFHANQGLVLFLLGVAISIVGSIIPLLGWLLILPLGYLGWFILAIMGIINAAGGKEKALPLIGGLKILK